MKYENRHSNIISALLAENRIIDALEYVKEHDTRHVCTDLLSGCGMTYRYMLSYFGRSTNGAIDTSRSKILADTREELLRAVDKMHVADIKSAAESQFFSTMRTLEIRDENTIANYAGKVRDLAVKTDIAVEADVRSDELQKSLEEVSEKLFDIVWTTVFLTKAEQDILLEFLTDLKSPAAFDSKALVLSALLLTSLPYYDYSKLELLLKCALTIEDTHLTARALTGALLIICKHEQRIGNDKTILDLAEAVCDDQRLSKAVRSFVPAMLRTIDTERVNKRFNDEILPELMRIKPGIEKSLRRMGGKPDIADLEKNPDWEELLEKSGIADTLKELTEMQQDGADIFMSAFAQMKAFPFFRKTANWLLPFDMNISDLKDIKQHIPRSMMTMLSAGQYFCSSDKYSMVFALAKMPRAQFDMMNSRMSEQMEGMKEEMSAALSALTVKLSVEVGLYLKDLYRYYKLKNDDGTDPFRDIFVIPAIAPFTTLHTDLDLQRNIAEFYFKYGYWEQAYEAFRVVASLGDGAEDVLQKQGYCLQLTGHEEEALNVYKQAELLNPESDWLIKRIATLLRDMKRYDESAEYARRALERKPDNLSLEMLLGTTLMLGGHADEALKSFFKISYLKPENTRVLRPIAWCEFLRGNYDKSIQQYDSLTDVTASDMLNCGHALFAKGDIPAAAHRYRTCVKMLDGGIDKFRTLMAEDTEYLHNAGVASEDISLMTELLVSDLIQ